MKKIFYTFWITILLIFFIGLSGYSQAITFTVDSPLDTPDNNIGDRICNDGNGLCTLRAAMQEANANTGFHDRIHFNIQPPGPHIIFPASQLPILTDNAGVTIDGSTQPNASIGNNPPLSLILMIEIKGQGYTYLSLL